MMAQSDGKFHKSFMRPYWSHFDNTALTYLSMHAPTHVLCYVLHPTFGPISMTGDNKLMD